MIVVADTSPLNYLILIDEIRLLPALFSKVLVPHAVWTELQHPESPRAVRDWAGNAPAWLELCPVASIVTPVLNVLDPGEAEAIQLALDRGLTIVLIDETQGRQIARSLHLEVRGTLGVLQRAAKLGQLDLVQAIKKLEQTNFRMSPAVRRALLSNG